uniref:Uncharacterized protein n=1 Tax=Timema poppense TaxID=170557 RepID=A0A7R9H362_TIMPO|nr:unnamed protein product [Timema poppensis]
MFCKCIKGCGGAKCSCNKAGMNSSTICQKCHSNCLNSVLFIEDEDDEIVPINSDATEFLDEIQDGPEYALEVILGDASSDIVSDRGDFGWGLERQLLEKEGNGVGIQQNWNKNKTKIARATAPRINRAAKDGSSRKDGCGGQNKNSLIIEMASKWLLCRVPPQVQTLEFYCLVTGHSFLPADRVFASIEKRVKKKEEIINPQDHVEILKEHGTSIMKKGHNVFEIEPEVISKGITVKIAKLKDVDNLLKTFW